METLPLHMWLPRSAGRLELRSVNETDRRKGEWKDLFAGKWEGAGSVAALVYCTVTPEQRAVTPPGREATHWQPWRHEPLRSRFSQLFTNTNFRTAFW